MTSHLEDRGSEEGSKSGLPENEEEIECSVCLLTAVLPVKLPCTHVFCFLCVKGIANRSKRCALCRQEIPPHFLVKPNLLKTEDLSKDISFDDGHQWYYEGTRGWWQYDERTSQELESNYKNNSKNVEILITGFLYIIDFENMIQFRRNDPSRRRRIKRDLINIPKKGIAGLRVKKPATEVPDRREGDGDDSEVAGTSNTPQNKTTSTNPACNNNPIVDSQTLTNTQQDNNEIDLINRNEDTAITISDSLSDRVTNRTEILEYISETQDQEEASEESVSNTNEQNHPEDTLETSMAELRVNDAQTQSSPSINTNGLWQM